MAPNSSPDKSTLPGKNQRNTGQAVLATALEQMTGGAEIRASLWNLLLRSGQVIISTYLGSASLQAWAEVPASGS